MELFLSSEGVFICIISPNLKYLFFTYLRWLCHKTYLEKLCNSRSLTLPFLWFGFLLMSSSNHHTLT